ncbi:MAG TPA: MliC family protein [Hydrogenophaga sp.]|mgnify:CR=1 FL=1|uniref:MliC family protein n=1 Tax=Hydrogenophaga sp. TaxID=1904254 RepID=UPI002C4C9CA1|nr:MliC family protein [Hydrogenophaga sp.]HMN93673.1 MliC family protein [Hydrogenophaga sp.]
MSAPARPFHPVMAALLGGFILLLAGCTAPGPQATEAPPRPGVISGPDFESHARRYRCAGGAELELVYLNLRSGLSFAALHHQGRTHLMQNRPSASGARYVALDEEAGLRWHSKGDEGFLAFLAADHTAREQVLLADCSAVTP